VWVNIGGKGMMERITCPVCCGDGQLEYEINRPQSFTRDVGYIDTVWGECLECHGEGEVEAEETP